LQVLCYFWTLLEFAGKGNQNLKQLVKEPFRNWKKSLEIFKYHQNLQYHKTALLDSASLIVNERQEIVSVQINKQRKEEIERNRKYLKPIIIETILLCGR